MSICYGFVGTKGSGKDSIALKMLEEDPEWKILKFAGKLKSICMEVYDLNYEEIEGGLKNELFMIPINLDDKIDALRKITGLDIEPKALVAYTPRMVLQYIGTEYVRSVQDDYWIKSLVDEILEKGSSEGEVIRKVVITDCRFENEAKALRDLLFDIVKINKSGFPAVNGDLHSSETEMNEIKYDRLFTNVYGEMEELDLFAKALVYDAED